LFALIHEGVAHVLMKYLPFHPTQINALSWVLIIVCYRKIQIGKPNDYRDIVIGRGGP